MAGGTIIRKVGETNLVECDTWQVYTDDFEAWAGEHSLFTADGGTSVGEPKAPPSAGKYFVKGWWTDANDKPIKEATVGSAIRFHIQTQGINDGEKIDFIVYDRDYFSPLNDKLVVKNKNKEISKITTQNDRGYIEWVTGEECLSLIEETFEGDEIELFVKCQYKDETIDLPAMESDYLILKEKEEVITVLIELPHSGDTNKINSKGLGGHTGIMIGDEYYDYGPQPRHPYKSEGRPWWDRMSQAGNFTKKDIITILSQEFPTQQEIDDSIVYYKNTKEEEVFPPTSRYSLEIIGRVCLIDIHIKGSEKNRIQKWWEDKYQNLGTYSVIPIVGKQCTTTVKNSIRKSTKVFSTFDITFSTLTPKGFLELLINKGEHTYGTKKGNKLTVNKEYREIPYIEIHDFKSSYNQQLSN